MPFFLENCESYVKKYVDVPRIIQENSCNISSVSTFGKYYPKLYCMLSYSLPFWQNDGGNRQFLNSSDNHKMEVR